MSDYAHYGECCMDGSTADLDSDDRVDDPHSRLERLQVRVLVWEDTEPFGIHSQANTCRYVLFGWLEPSIALGLFTDNVEFPE